MIPSSRAKRCSYSARLCFRRLACSSSRSASSRRAKPSRVSIVLAQIMTVVRSHKRQAQIFFEPKQSGVNVVFPFQALVLNLQKEIFFPKDVTVSRGGFTGGFVVVFHQALGHLTFQTAG